MERLEYAKRYRQSLVHAVQRLRDEAAEREADAAEVERLRAEGLPVLSAEEVAEADEVLRIERLVTEDGEPVPEDEWPNVPGARVQVVKDWVYPDDEYDEESEDGTGEEDDDYEPAEPYQQYAPVWVVTDLDASGLRRRGGGSASNTADSGDEGESEEEAEARREERRRVIANNKAWASVLLTAPPEDPSTGPRRRWRQWMRHDRRCSTGTAAFPGSGRFAPVRRQRCPSPLSTGAARRSGRCRRSCGT